MNSKINFSTSTAILLFAQSEQTEVLSKNVSSSSKKNLLLWKKMNQKAVQTVKTTQLPYFISNETTQVGADFGTKLTHAIQSVFEKGFGKVIVIGNDSLALSASMLLKAEKQLQNQEVVLGADFHGGAYLIGVSKTSFNGQDFQSVNWQSHSVFSELKIIFSSQNIAFLPKLHDCNDRNSFEQSLNMLWHSSRIRAFLMALLQERLSVPVLVFLSQLDTFTQEFNNKGSPVWS